MFVVPAQILCMRLVRDVSVGQVKCGVRAGRQGQYRSRALKMAVCFELADVAQSIWLVGQAMSALELFLDMINMRDVVGGSLVYALRARDGYPVSQTS